MQFKECIAKWADSSPNAIAAEYFSHAKEDGETVGAPSANYNPLTIAARLYAQSLSLRDNGALAYAAAAQGHTPDPPARRL